MDHYSAAERKGILPPAMTGMNLEDLVPSEVN